MTEPVRVLVITRRCVAGLSPGRHSGCTTDQLMLHGGGLDESASLPGLGGLRFDFGRLRLHHTQRGVPRTIPGHAVGHTSRLEPAPLRHTRALLLGNGNVLRVDGPVVSRRWGRRHVLRRRPKCRGWKSQCAAANDRPRHPAAPRQSLCRRLSPQPERPNRSRCASRSTGSRCTTPATTGGRLPSARPG